MSEKADILVIGLGAMGSAALYQLAKRGVKAVGLDRFAPPHTMGSSHGETRITRQAVGEGRDYVPLVLDTHRIWRELEAETSAELLNPCGLVVIRCRAGSLTDRGQLRTVAAQHSPTSRGDARS